MDGRIGMITVGLIIASVQFASSLSVFQTAKTKVFTFILYLFLFVGKLEVKFYPITFLNFVADIPETLAGKNPWLNVKAKPRR